MFVCFLQEAMRNGYGYCMVYSHDPGVEGGVYPSPWPQFFNDVNNCQVKSVFVLCMPVCRLCREVEVSVGHNM